MSMMTCDECAAYIDTDYDVEGVYADKLRFFMCSSCCEEHEIETPEALDKWVADELAALTTNGAA